MSLSQETQDALKEKLLATKERIEGELRRFSKPSDDNKKFTTKFPDDIGSSNDENATEVEEYTDNLAVEKDLKEQLKDITDALKKIDAGTYGLDEETGEPIDPARLEAYPAARTNVRSNE